MALVRNPSAATLGETSQLTSVSTENPKIDRRSNIFGGAALLAKSQGGKTTALGDCLGAVNSEGGSGKVFEAVIGTEGGELYADQVFETIKNGARHERRVEDRSPCLPRASRRR